MMLNNVTLNKAITKLKVGQLFSVIHNHDEQIDCWKRVEDGYYCVVDDTGWVVVGDPHFCWLGDDDWTPDTYEFRVYDMDESARIIAVLALSGKLPWAGKKL